MFEYAGSTGLNGRWSRWSQELLLSIFCWTACDEVYKFAYVYPVTKHDFLAFLAASRDNYRNWPDLPTLYADLRLNTPEGQARWDQQARALISRMLTKGLIQRIPCPGGTRGCGNPHLALTKLGEAQLETWNEMGCEAHTHVAHCQAPDRDFGFKKKKVS